MLLATMALLWERALHAMLPAVWSLDNRPRSAPLVLSPSPLDGAQVPRAKKQ